MRRHQRPGRIHQDGPRVDVDRHPVRSGTESDWMLHPGVRCQHQNARERAADGHSTPAPPVRACGEALPSIEIQSEEDCLDEERVALERKGRPDQRPRELHESRPQQTQLEGEGGARDGADGKGDGL